MIYQYPLNWPVGLSRTVHPLRSRFDMSEDKVKRDLERQFVLMLGSDVIITTNVELRRDGRPYVGQRITDCGVAVYFKRSGRDQVIACDKWNSIKDNLEAVAKTIEALRGIDRWGTGDMVDAAFAGFTAITANASAGTPFVPPQPWYDVLHVAPDAPREVIDAAYKARLKTSHPDAGGAQGEFESVQKAYEEAQQ